MKKILQTLKPARAAKKAAAEPALTEDSSSEFILSNSRDYSIYVCQSRGIPSVSDGLKDSQRKALFVIKPKGDKIKTISLAGEMISANVYLHSDASATEMLSLMAAPYCNNIPLLHGVGAFGTRVGPTDWGAARYTYLKKSAATDALIYPDHDIVPMKENYDGSVLEPKNYLPLIPLVLLNGISGIAVGWSTDILPHRLSDIIDSTLAAIDGKAIPTLVPHYEFLDCEVKTIGENVWEFVGKVRIDGHTVHVEELPPDMSLEKFKTKLNKMEEDNLIQTYVDRSTKHIKIEIKMRRGSLPAQWNTSDVVAYFGLKTKCSQRLVTLDWDGDSIKQFKNTTELVKEFVQWRLGFYTVRYQKLITDLSSELAYYQALKTCYDKKLPSFLPTAANRAEVKNRVVDLTKNHKITDEQVERIVSLASYRWAKDFYQQVIDRIAALVKDIDNYQAILRDPKKIRKIYRQEVEQLRKIPAVTR